MDFKKQLELHLETKGKGDYTYRELYELYPFDGMDLNPKAQGDRVRNIVRSLARRKEIQEEILYNQSLKTTVEDYIETDPVEKGLILKSKWQGPDGKWRYSYQNNNNGGLDKQEYQKIISNLEYKKCKVAKLNTEKSNNQLLVFTDQHLGMSAKGNLFNLDWNLKEYYKRLDQLIVDAKPNHNIHIAMLGDFTDGLGEKTNRGGHKLQQNMSDKEMFKHGLESIIYLIDNIYKKTKGLIKVHYITNSNHPGVTDYSIGIAANHICQNRYGSGVEFNVLEDFVSRIEIEGNPILLTHGYDESLLMKGYPRILTTAHINKLRTIVDYFGDKYPIILRGDLHQYTDIDYVFFRDIICPAFSNPSGWVSMNFSSPNKGGYLSCTFENSIPQFKFNRF